MSTQTNLRNERLIPSHIRPTTNGGTDRSHVTRFAFYVHTPDGRDRVVLEWRESILRDPMVHYLARTTQTPDGWHLWLSRVRADLLRYLHDDMEGLKPATRVRPRCHETSVDGEPCCGEACHDGSHLYCTHTTTESSVKWITVEGKDGDLIWIGGFAKLAGFPGLFRLSAPVVVRRQPNI